MEWELCQSRWVSCQVVGGVPHMQGVEVQVETVQFEHKGPL